ncbi:unnamed protein product [Sphenostylis stenocarpa]|uniref:Uncharacterized protein n=1 Tax=Sphenostylis stenocarpa TaxID=92480 RepID=A0AA86SW33_9FABA|nr:unnamed protein product [Sphenostylis stenocarpa]
MKSCQDGNQTYPKSQMKMEARLALRERGQGWDWRVRVCGLVRDIHDDHLGFAKENQESIIGFTLEAVSSDAGRNPFSSLKIFETYDEVENE